MPIGLSLLETTIAIAVIITGLFAAFTLVFAYRRASEEMALRFGATQAAREGVEAIRAIRDSNWLAERAWDAGIAGAGTDYTGVPVLGHATGAWSVAYQPNDLTSPLTRIVRRRDVRFATQGVVGDDDIVVTPYRRMVTLTPICADGSIVPAGLTCTPDASPPAPKVGIRVRATVQWQGRSMAHDITMEERLYDWR